MIYVIHPCLDDVLAYFLDFLFFGSCEVVLGHVLENTDESHLLGEAASHCGWFVSSGPALVDSNCLWVQPR